MSGKEVEALPIRRGPAGHWAEGKQSTSWSATKDDSLNLAKGDKGQLVGRVRVATYGVLGDLTIIFFDGAPATTAITGTLRLNAQPPEGFPIYKSVGTGTLGWRLAGRTGGNEEADVNIQYGY